MYKTKNAASTHHLAIRRSGTFKNTAGAMNKGNTVDANRVYEINVPLRAGITPRTNDQCAAPIRIHQ